MIDMTRDPTCTATSYANCEVWAQADRIGSVVATTDSTGAVIEVVLGFRAAWRRF